MRWRYALPGIVLVIWVPTALIHLAELWPREKASDMQVKLLKSTLSASTTEVPGAVLPAPPSAAPATKSYAEMTAWLDAENFSKATYDMSKATHEAWIATWERQLQSAIARGPSDPCKADIIGSMAGFGVGFGNRANNFVNELWLAMYGGFTLSFWANEEFVRMWFDHFENSILVPLCHAPVCPPSLCDHKERPWYIATRAAWKFAGTNGFNYWYLAHMKRFLYGKIYVPKEAYRKHINTVLRAAGFEEGKPFIGVHVRQGDKVNQGATSVERYGEAILEVVTRHPSLSSVFLASDSPDARGILQGMLGNKATVYEQPRLPNSAYTQRGRYPDENGTLLLLADVEALRRATVFIGTQTSNLGRLVWFLRTPGAEAISLDGDGNNHFFMPGG